MTNKACLVYAQINKNLTVHIVTCDTCAENGTKNWQTKIVGNRSMKKKEKGTETNKKIKNKFKNKKINKAKINQKKTGEKQRHKQYIENANCIVK